MTTLQDVRREIEDLHRFFVRWFNGTASDGELDRDFAQRLDDTFSMVTPEGTVAHKQRLISLFRQSRGSGPDFRIDIRDVEILRQDNDLLVARYTEWQRGSRVPGRAQNARVSTLLLTRAMPFRWLQVHETWLPEAAISKEAFNF